MPQSEWTRKFHKKYPGLKFDKKLISKTTGISVSNLGKVYDQGIEAWHSVKHPVGNPYQWGVSRVYKYVLKK
jgi:hypothetical protein